MAPVPTVEAASPVAGFAADVARDLSVVPKRLDPKYLYDDLGSSLFAAICELPWYRVTRAEKRLLRRHGTAIAKAAGPRVRVIELGCGTGEKLQIVMQAIARAGTEATVHLVDVSPLALEQTSRRVAGSGVPVVCHQAIYQDGMTSAAAGSSADEPMLALFLGSNIGNFDPATAVSLLADIRASLRPGDHLLLGVDLVKPEADLQLAYDDPLGVTAAFNRNLLARMNRELDADFDLAAFRHVARWNGAESRVEMHLESAGPQMVRIPGARITATFFTGETIWTESSYKYEEADVQSMARVAGFDTRELWVEEDARFALALLDAA